MKTRHILSVSAIALLAAACGSAPPLTPLPPQPTSNTPTPVTSSSTTGWAPTPDASFRANAPKAGPESPWSAPVPEEAKLSNGVRVLSVSRPKLPMIALHVSTLKGSDQQNIAGLGNFMGEMLDQGTATRSALQLSDDFEEIGADHGTWSDWDSCNVSLKILTQHLDS